MVEITTGLVIGSFTGLITGVILAVGKCLGKSNIEYIKCCGCCIIKRIEEEGENTTMQELEMSQSITNV